MQLTVDAFDRTTAYADLRDDELLTDQLRVRAISRGRELGAEHVEFWNSPYGRGADRMAGFVELARVPKTEDNAVALVAPAASHGTATFITAPTHGSVEQV